MAFKWVVRHQKKVLFVLALVLIVGWGLTDFLGRLTGRGGARRGTSACGRIAGEDVSYAEFATFKRAWGQVFPDIFSRYAMERLYPGGEVTVDDVAWAYVGLLKTARKINVTVSDGDVLELKRAIYQRQAGYGARLDDTEQVRRWLRDEVGMSGPMFDQILRERLMAERMLGYLARWLEPTEQEALELYRRENRAVRIRYVTFSRDAFLARTAEPADERVQEYYEARRGQDSGYFIPAAAQIEYAAVDVSRLEAGLKPTEDEMKKFYEENKALYPAAEGKGAAPQGFNAPLAFSDVLPRVEAMMKRSRAWEKATQALSELRTAYEQPAAPPVELETLVANRRDGVLQYHRTAFLTEVGLAELPLIGTARAGGMDVVELAFALDHTKRQLSGIIACPTALFVLRPAAPVRAESVPALADVKRRVVADIRKEEALEEAKKAAKGFLDEVEKEGGAGKFEDSARKRGLAIRETPFFISNGYDVNCPDFIERDAALEVGSLCGPMTSLRDGIAAVARVVDERKADPEGFAAERKLKLDYVRQTKTTEFFRAAFPGTILEFLGYENLIPPSERADESTGEETPPPVPDCE